MKLHRIKIAMVCGSYPPDQDGVGDYTSILCKELEKMDVVVRIFSTKSKNARKIYNLTTVSNWGVWETLKITHKIKQEDINIVHIQYPSKYRRSLGINLIPILIRIFLSKRIKVVFTIHEFLSYSFLGRLRIYLSVLFCHKLIIPDKANLLAIERFLPFLMRKLVSIPIGSNINPLTIKSSYAIDRTPTIVYFGIVRPKKGIENLLKALAYLDGVSLLIIGEIDKKNSYHNRILKLIETLGLKSRIKITGYCPEGLAHRYLLSGDIAVLPFPDGVSERRGTFLAAMCHGLPVITTKGYYIPDGLKDEENVKFVEPEKPEALCNTIKYLLRDQELRMKIGKNGLAWAQRYSWNKIAAEHLMVYRELL